MDLAPLLSCGGCVQLHRKASGRASLQACAQLHRTKPMDNSSFNSLDEWAEAAEWLSQSYKAFSLETHLFSLLSCSLSRIPSTPVSYFHTEQWRSWKCQYCSAERRLYTPTHTTDSGYHLIGLDRRCLINYPLGKGGRILEQRSFRSICMILKSF